MLPAAAALAMPTEWEDTACDISSSSAKDGNLATGSSGAASTDTFVEAARGDYPAQSGPLYDGFIIFLGPSIIAATDAAIIAAHDDGRRSCKKKPRCGGEAARRPGPDRGR
jgi:hypothetical protein